MSTPTGNTERATRRLARRFFEERSPDGSRQAFLRRLTSNFVILGVSEVLCRSISVFVTLSLARRLGSEGFGRIEFAFNVVFWLVLIVRDCFESIVTREIARHPRLTRKLVNHVVAVKLALAAAIFIGLAAVGLVAFSNAVDRQVLVLYGLLLFTTALGLDFAFRGRETMGLVAVSLFVRTCVYSVGVCVWVNQPGRILLVPTWLALGEFTGIALVWVVYARKFGIPRPVLGRRFLVVLAKRGRSVGLIHLCQAVIISADLMVVGVCSPWAEVGRYGASHRMVSAIMAFGLIFQQVIFPALSRSWRASSDACRGLMDFSVRVLFTGFLPVALGGTVLSESLVEFLLPAEYRASGLLLAVGVWRAPLLSLAFLCQACLIATNLESQGVRLLTWGAVVSAPLIAVFRWQFGLIGASSAVLLIGLGLVVSGYVSLRKGHRHPSIGKHLARPLLAACVMIPVALVAARMHVMVAVLAGALTYLFVLKVSGGLAFTTAQLPPTGGPPAGADVS